MKKCLGFTLVLVVVVVLPLALATHARADEENNRPERLVGTWVVNVTANPISICNGPQIAPGPPPFIELVTYATGGTLTETNSELNPNSAASALGLAGSDGHGAWERDGSQYKSLFRKLLFDATGAYVGNADLNESLTVSPSGELSGSFNIKFDFGNARPAICSSGSVTGQRLSPSGGS